jgi:arrestin-1
LANTEAEGFGIVISYTVKVKLFLGALSGELAAELPFVLMHPKVCESF